MLASLCLHLDDIVDADRINLPSLAASGSDHFEIGVLDDRGMYVVCMSGRDIVDALIEIHDGHGIPGFRYQARNIAEQLLLR
jgi:hypothetical protein